MGPEVLEERPSRPTLPKGSSQDPASPLPSARLSAQCWAHITSLGPCRVRQVSPTPSSRNQGWGPRTGPSDKELGPLRLPYCKHPKSPSHPGGPACLCGFFCKLSWGHKAAQGRKSPQSPRGLRSGGPRGPPLDTRIRPRVSAGPLPAELVSQCPAVSPPALPATRGTLSERCSPPVKPFLQAAPCSGHPFASQRGAACVDRRGQQAVGRAPAGTQVPVCSRGPTCPSEMLPKSWLLCLRWGLLWKRALCRCVQAQRRSLGWT